MCVRVCLSSMRVYVCVCEFVHLKYRSLLFPFLKEAKCHIAPVRLTTNRVCIMLCTSSVSLCEFHLYIHSHTGKHTQEDSQLRTRTFCSDSNGSALCWEREKCIRPARMLPLSLSFNVLQQSHVRGEYTTQFQLLRRIQWCARAHPDNNYAYATHTLFLSLSSILPSYTHTHTCACRETELHLFIGTDNDARAHSLLQTVVCRA